MGRPGLTKAIKELIVRMATENSGWGYCRVQGELKGVGHRVAGTTIANVLKENGIKPAPDRPSSWRSFLKAHYRSAAIVKPLPPYLKWARQDDADDLGDRRLRHQRALADLLRRLEKQRTRPNPRTIEVLDRTRYVARPPIAAERLSLSPDGPTVYRFHRRSDGRFGAFAVPGRRIQVSTRFERAVVSPALGEHSTVLVEYLGHTLIRAVQCFRGGHSILRRARMRSKTRAIVPLVAAIAVSVLFAAPCDASLVDNGDGTVTQTLADGSQLMWLKDANLAATQAYPAYGSTSGGVGMSFDDCLAWIDTLNAGSGFAGYTDWRMPSALNPDGSGPSFGFAYMGGTGEMIYLSLNEGVWFNASTPPGMGPFINMQSSYWTGTSGIDEDDGVWNFVAGSLSQSILQSKLRVVGPGISVPRRFSAWAVRVEAVAFSNYCTAGVSASGCQAALSATGVPSATGTSGFYLAASGVEGAKDGLFFYGSNGRQANSWGSGTSFQCVVPPVRRAGLLAGSGTSGLCDGTFSQDLNALWCAACPSPLKNPGAGAVVQAQLWYRDPFNTSNQTTSLSAAIEFSVKP